MLKFMHPDDNGASGEAATTVVDTTPAAPEAPVAPAPTPSRADKFADMVKQDIDSLFGDDVQNDKEPEEKAPAAPETPAPVEQPKPVESGKVVLPPEYQRELDELRVFKRDYERTQEEARQRQVQVPQQQPDEAADLADYRKRAEKAGLKFVDKDGKPLSDEVVKQYRSQREFEIAEYMKAQGITPEFLKSTQQHNERSQKIAEALAVQGLESGLTEEKTGILSEFGKEAWDEHADDMRKLVASLTEQGVALDPTGKNGPSLRQIFHDVVGRRALSSRKAAASEATAKAQAGAKADDKRKAANSGGASPVDSVSPGSSAAGQQQKLSRADRFAISVAGNRLG